jgi:hypothetical protein
MEQVLNQYSALWIAGALVLLVVLVMLRHKPTLSDYVALGVVVVGLGVAWIMLHPRQTLLMEDATRVQQMIGAGKPVLLEFQSPY